MLLRGFLCTPPVILVPACNGMDIGGNTHQPNNGMNNGDGGVARGLSESKKNANQMQSTQEQDSGTAHHSTQGGGTKAGVFRFTFARDKQLLLEVKDLNPFAALNPVKVWEVIRHNMFTIFGMSGSHRTFADRTKLLILKHKSNETQYLKRSGVDEEFTEFRALLLEVVQIYDNAAQLKMKDTLSFTLKGIDAPNDCLQELGDVDANDDVDEPGESYAVYEQSLNVEAAVCVHGDNNNRPPLSIASMSPTPGPTSPAATCATSTKVSTKGSKRPMDSYGHNEGGTQTKQRRGDSEALQYLERKYMMELEVKRQELRIKEVEANKRTAELEILKQKEEMESQRFQATMDLLQTICARVKDSSELQMNANTGAESELAEDQIDTTTFPLQVNNPGDMLQVQLNVGEDPRPVFNGIPNKCTCDNFNRDDQTWKRTLNRMYEEQCRANRKTEEYRAKKMKLLEEQAKYHSESMALYQ